MCVCVCVLKGVNSCCCCSVVVVADVVAAASAAAAADVRPNKIGITLVVDYYM